MLRSLRARLLVAIIGVAAVSLALAGWLFSRVTVVRFQDYQTTQRVVAPQPEISSSPLEDFFQQHNSWRGVEPLLEKMQQQYQQRFLLTLPDRSIAAVSAPELRGAQITIGPEGLIDIESTGPRAEKLKLRGPHAIPLRVGQQHAGSLYVLPLAPQAAIEAAAGDAPEEKFATEINRSLVAVILLVLAMATAVALWLARRIVHPVEALTAAVEKIRAGDLRQQVSAPSNDELGRLARAFNSMAAQLARVESLRREMTSDVAHELRTPLTNIRAQIEALQDGLSQPSPQVIASLHEEALHLARLVDDLRDLSLADAGQLRIVPERLAPAAALDQAIAALQPRAAARRITLARNYNGALPEISADPVRLGQILRNLLDNAIRHTPPDGTVTLEARADATRIHFTIRDTGPGIAPEHLPNIFERFYRTDPSRTRETGGAGLGLAIVKQLVTAHAGAIRAESTPGHGAAFHIDLPTK